jgi:acyl carrier protein
MKKNNKDLIRKVILKTFNKSKIPKNISNLKIGDIKEWDSLGNFNLLLEIEQTFKIRFDLIEIENLKSVPAILKALKKNDK